MAKARRTGSNRYVEIDTGNALKVRCDTQFGGTPLEWFVNGVSMVNPFPGSGASQVPEFGQDPTQATANGFLSNPIARLIWRDPQAKYYYYGSEILLSASGKYVVAGFWPIFWLSHEAMEDVIPLDVATHTHGWGTLYSPHIFPADRYTAMDLPIFFAPKGSCTAGIFLMGNEMVNLGLPPSHRLARIQEGRMSAKARISLSAASPTAFGGMVFRKNIPRDSNLNLDTAWGAPGYMLLANRNRIWTLHRTDRLFGPNPIVATGLLPNKNINKDIGTQLEFRTDNYKPGRIQLYADDVLLTTFNDASPILGDAIGLIAYSDAGYVKFTDRQVFHMGFEGIVSYSVTPDSRILMEQELRLAGGVSTPIELYRFVVTFFMNQQTLPIPDRRMLVYDKAGNVRPNSEGVLINLNEVSKLESGSLSRQPLRLVLSDIETSLNGAPSPGAHCLLDRCGFNDEFTMALNALPALANNVPVLVSSAKIKAVIGNV